MNSLHTNIVSGESVGSSTHSDKLQYGEYLLNGFTKLFDDHSVLAEMQQHFGNEQKLRILCYQLSEYPTLIEAIKASSNNNDQFIERALFCSWFCFLMAGPLKLSVNATKNLFIAGLIQDIAESGGGHLKELSSIFADHAGSLNDDIYGENHPVVTSRFLGLIPRLPGEVKSIVRAHHERFDGTGFPDGKVEQQLSIVQKVLIVSNDIADLCKRHADRPYDLSSILPILKLNASVYFRPVFNAALKVITPGNVEPEAHSRATITTVLDTQSQLLLRWSHLLSATAELKILPENHTVITLKQIARRAWMLVTTAGILSDDLSLWLSQLNDENEGNRELFELEILLGELNSMISSYQQHLKTLINDSRVEISDSKRALLNDLCESMTEQQESIDLSEFSILNMCD